MLKKALALSVVSLLASAGARADDAKKTEATTERPKPGPEHEKLGYWVGTWTLDGTMNDGPMGKGGKVSGKTECSWWDGRFAVVCKDSGTSPMGPMRGMGIMSWNREEKRYEYYGIDNAGMQERALGGLEGDSWVYTNDVKMDGKTFKGRYTMTNLKPDSYDFKWEMSEDGTTWNTVMEGTHKRKGGRSARVITPSSGMRGSAAAPRLNPREGGTATGRVTSRK
jgi:hypothetical protein